MIAAVAQLFWTGLASSDRGDQRRLRLIDRAIGPALDDDVNGLRSTSPLSSIS
jgi:hypothetical protein